MLNQEIGCHSKMINRDERLERVGGWSFAESTGSPFYGVRRHRIVVSNLNLRFGAD